MTIQQTLNTIGAIYDTALNPELWSDALEQTAVHIGARVALLGVSDPAYPETQLIAASTSYGDSGEAYLRFSTQPEEQRMIRAMQQRPPQSIFRDTDVWDVDTLKALPIASWMAEHLGIFHRCGTLLCKHRGWTDGMVFGYAKERAGMSVLEEQQLQLLLPHLARTVEIQRPLSILRRRFNAVMSVLDRLHVGIAILFNSGDVILHNQAAEQIFNDRDGLSLNAARRLISHHPDNTAKLSATLDKVIATAQLQGDCAGETMVVSRPSGKTPYILEAAPLRDSEYELEHNLQGAMLFIIDPEKSAVVSIRGLALAYQLSTAEQDVCQHLINGLSNDAIADSRGVGRETVKTQIASIFSKTHTQNRAELIHLALKIAPPIDPQD